MARQGWLNASAKASATVARMATPLEPEPGHEPEVLAVMHMAGQGSHDTTPRDASSGRSATEEWLAPPISQRRRCRHRPRPFLTRPCRRRRRCGPRRPPPRRRPRRRPQRLRSRGPSSSPPCSRSRPGRLRRPGGATRNRSCPRRRRRPRRLQRARGPPSRSCPRRRRRGRGSCRESPRPRSCPQGAPRSCRERRRRCLALLPSPRPR